MTRTELLIKIKQEVKGLIKYLASQDYENAVDDASRETGWSHPVTGDFKIYWIKQRAKRHLYEYLLTESAHKFKYEQINLQHRFEHYSKLIKVMDEQFEKVQDERPDQFANVDTFKMFGTKADAGFAYISQTGQDITYLDVQLVEFGPKEND